MTSRSRALVERHDENKYDGNFDASTTYRDSPTVPGEESNLDDDSITVI